MKKSIILGLAVFTAFNMVGCSEHYTSVTDEKEVVDSDVKYSGGDTYVKKFDKKFSVDAKVNIPKNVNMSVVSVEKQKFDEQKNIDIWAPNKKLERFEDEDIVALRGDNETISFGSTGILASKENQKTLYSSEIYSYCEKKEWNKDSIEGISKEEAVKLAMDFCDKLSIGIDKNVYEVKAVDKENLKKYEDYLLKNDDVFNQFIKDGKIKKTDIDSKSEMYIININTLIEGMPIIKNSIILKDADGCINGSNIKFYITSEGVQRFEVNGSIYNKKEVKKDKVDIISLDEATDKLYSFYSNLLTSNEIFIKEISLEYAPSIEELGVTSYDMSPVWTFEMLVKNEEYKTEDTEYRYIDAITGKEIR